MAPGKGGVKLTGGWGLSGGTGGLAAACSSNHKLLEGIHVLYFKVWDFKEDEPKAQTSGPPPPFTSLAKDELSLLVVKTTAHVVKYRFQT
jgi:hypothetical protein